MIVNGSKRGCWHSGWLPSTVVQFPHISRVVLVGSAPRETGSCESHTMSVSRMRRQVSINGFPPGNWAPEPGFTCRYSWQQGSQGLYLSPKRE
jgi:hypothetical protein